MSKYAVALASISEESLVLEITEAPSKSEAMLKVLKEHFFQNVYDLIVEELKQDTSGDTNQEAIIDTITMVLEGHSACCVVEEI